MSTQATGSPPLPPATGGSHAAEIAIFSAVLAGYAAYHCYYFARHRLRCAHGSDCGFTIDLWVTALESRIMWATEMMRDKSEGLLVVQTMRNVITASTLIVMAMAQVLGRMLEIVFTPIALQQIDYFVSLDPIAPHSFSSAEVKMGLAIALMLLSFGAFTQSARLAVHMSFMFRVAPNFAQRKRHLEAPIQEELVAMTHRVSLYFTLGIRLLFLWAIMLAWCFGITAFLIFASVVLLLLGLSDFIPTKTGAKIVVLEEA